MVLQTFLSQRGGEKLAADGYIYVKDRNHWRCERKAKSNFSKCAGRGKRVGDEFIISTQHNHLPDMSEMANILFKVLFKFFLNKLNRFFFKQFIIFIRTIKKRQHHQI